MLRQITLCGLLLIPAAETLAAANSTVTLYQCKDSKGKLTWRDEACPKNQTTVETRNMTRPVDPPKPITPPAPAPSKPAPATQELGVPKVVYISPPRPLYECVDPDGKRYTSETNEGNPRWVPAWTLGYPAYYPPGPPPGYSGGVSGSVQYQHKGVSVGIQGGQSVHYPAPPPAYYAQGAGTWIRDECHALPQAEVCSRLRDRRDEIRKKFFNGFPSEREVLTKEERSVNARLANDCGAY